MCRIRIFTRSSVYMTHWDVFFASSPGFGFLSPTSSLLTQIASPPECGPSILFALNAKSGSVRDGIVADGLGALILRSLQGVLGVVSAFD